MIEYVKKSDVLEIINSPLPRDLTAEYIFDLKGVWLDEDTADTPQTDMDEDIVRSYGFKVESYRQAKAKDEPPTDCGWK